MGAQAMQLLRAFSPPPIFPAQEHREQEQKYSFLSCFLCLFLGDQLSVEGAGLPSAACCLSVPSASIIVNQAPLWLVRSFLGRQCMAILIPG